MEIQKRPQASNLVERCGVFPSFILYSTLHDAAAYIEMFPAYYIFNTLLVTLQMLNVVWTYFIFRVFANVSFNIFILLLIFPDYLQSPY